jgi:hypothetical protein
MKRVYDHKIKSGAREKMRSVVKMMFWQTLEALEEGTICCITETESTRNFDLLEKAEKKDNPMVYRVKPFNPNSKAEAFILEDLVEVLPETEWIFENTEKYD